MLAAEYVLGTLRGRARARFERLLEEDRRLRPLVAYWESRLGQLGLDLTPVAPPDSVWQVIERRVGRVPAAERPVQRPARRAHPPLWRRLGFWRGWAAAATAACLALAITYWAVPAFTPHAVRMHYMSVMDMPRGQAQWVIMFYPGEKRLQVKTISSSYNVPENRALELWVLPQGQKKPVSLGIMPKSGSGWMPMPTPAGHYIGARARLAVSVEPKGGSPTGRPTGPIVCTAQVMRMQ